MFLFYQRLFLGGGHLFDSGLISLRMVLFAMSLIISMMLFTKNVDKKGITVAVTLVFGFICTHIPALFIGYFNGADSNDIFLDLSPLLYWLIAPFFAIVLQSKQMVLRTAQIIKVSTLAMATCYLFVVIGLITNVINYTYFSYWGNNTGEILFRNEYFFFYKGFIYLGIGLLFFIAIGGRWRNISITILSIALVLTLTRGFILSTSISCVLFILLKRQIKEIVPTICICSVAVFLVFVYLPSLDDGFLLKNQEISTLTRIDDGYFFIENINLSNLFFGSGFGSFINERLAIENSFITIFWKFGIVGLIFWWIPFFLTLRYFLRIKHFSHHYNLACAYFLGVVLIYIQTSTNPYLNNPIGLSFVIIAIFSLQTLSKITGILEIDSRSLSENKIL